MKDEYERLYGYYNGENPPRKDVLIAKINAEKYKDIASNYNQ